MPRRRKLAQKRFNAINNAVPKYFGVQSLEQRLLFTTLSAGTGLNAAQQFDYIGQNGGLMRIVYYDVTFEAIGVSVDPKTDATTVGDLVPASMSPLKAPALPFNLFTIYVTQSAPDSYITVAPIPPLTATTGVRVDIPFGAGLPLTIIPADGLGLLYSVTPGAAIGGGVLGAYDFAVKGVAPADYPIWEVPDQALGIYPGGLFADGFLHAGFYVLNSAVNGAPQDFDAFKFAGEVFGNIQISGNIQMLYAGAILTGDADGGFLPTNASSPAVTTNTPNFVIGGDLQDLVTSGDIGGDIGNAGGLVNGGVFFGNLPNYDTGFAGVVDGKLGQIKQLTGGFYGTMDVVHDPNVTGFTDATPALKIPYQDTDVFLLGDPNGTGQVFQGNNPFNFLPGVLPSQLPSPPFAITSPATEQYLGSQQTIDTNGNIILNQDGKPIYDTEVTGTLQNSPGMIPTTVATQFPNSDAQDWYGVSLMAGQTITITVKETDTNKRDIYAEVEDPDGRIIASDIDTTAQGVFQITPDRPGIYSIGLTPNGILAQALNLSYLLKIAGTGDQGFGVLNSPTEISDMGENGFFEVDNGDLGALITAGNIESATFGPALNPLQGSSYYAPSSIIVARGDLRAVIANTIGQFTTTIGILGTSNVSGNALATVTNPLYLSVPNGNVGLIAATGTRLIPALDVLVLDTQFDPNYFRLPTPLYRTDDAFAHAIGGYIQRISAGAALFADLAVNQGIGTIDANNMATVPASHIDVNADNTGDDGIIDMIDVPGSFGTLGGGPEFVTNTGGNIRYLNATGTVFLPSAYGGQVDLPVTYPPNIAETFTDDSGAVFTFTGVGPLTLVNVNNSNGTTSQVSTGTTVTTLSYPVLDKAGLVPISITATASGQTSAGSLSIFGTGVNGANSEVDVANISILGNGRPITQATSQASTGVVTNLTDPNGNTLLEQAVPTGGQDGIPTGNAGLSDPTDLYLSITGPAQFNVLNVSATTTLPINAPVEISDATQGEIVNINAPNGIGTIITGGNLGFATPQATPASVRPLVDIQDGNTYPFVQQTTGVVIGTGFVISDTDPTSLGTTGDVLNVDVGGAVGNVEAGGTIQSLIANFAQSSGNRNAKPIYGQFDGVVGPILATRLLYVDVGQGLMPTGTGLVGFSGLYGTGKIGIVTNAGNPNGDIRGNIVSAEDPVVNETTLVGIDEVDISSASIIGSELMTVEDLIPHSPGFIESSELSPIGGVVKTNGQNFAPGQPSYTYDIGPIIVSGLGGIIGMTVYTGSVASITVNAGGFGIFTSDVDGQSQGGLGTLSASGYGIRDSTFRGFGYIGPVTATGKGGLVPVTAYPLDVHPSDISNSLDPFFGVTPNAGIDINAVLGTSALTPNIPNRTDTGVIEDDIFNGLNNFTSLTAQKSRTQTPEVTTNQLPTPDTLNIPVIGDTFSNSITFGSYVGPIHIAQEVDGFQITAGKLGGLSLSSSVNRLGISVAGAIQSLTVHGNLGKYLTDPLTGNLIPDSYINAGGPDSSIGSVHVTGNMNSNIYCTGPIGSIVINGDLLGGVIAFGKTNSLALGSLHVFGGIRNSALILNGNVGSIIVNGTLGTASGSLTVHGSANLISVGAGHHHASQLALALTVDNTLKSLVVYGTITGTVNTGLDLTSLSVTDDGSSPSAISGAITVGGRLGTAKILNGNVAANIVVSNNIGTFTITKGNLNAGISLQSLLGNLGTFKIAGGLAYGAYGSILALESNNTNIDISGNLGDGVNALMVTANSGISFRIRGSVVSGATVAVTTALDLLRVDGSVLTGATISAHPLKKQKIGGTDTGVIIAV